MLNKDNKEGSTTLPPPKRKRAKSSLLNPGLGVERGGVVQDWMTFREEEEGEEEERGG